jgi:hypothetical protein
MPDNEQIFEIQTPSGHVLTIRAADQQKALEGAQQWHQENSSLWGNIKDIPGSAAYGFTKGLSTLGSALGQATAHEMGQPELAAEIPGGQRTFEEAQKNITGPLAQPTTPFGSWAAKTGEMTALNPLASLSPVSSVIGTGVSAGASEAGRKAFEGTPLETPAELAAGVLGHSAVATTVKGVGKGVAGAQTMFSGAGPRATEEAFRAGTLGKSSTESQKYIENVTGRASQDEIIPYAEKALSNMKAQRSADYVRDMGEMERTHGTTSLSFDPIDKSLEHSQTFATRYGQPIDRATQPVRDQAAAIVNDWRVKASHDPRLATPYGMDGLKQKIWNEVVAPLPEDTAQRAAAMTVYNGVKKAIVDQAPQYKGIMEHYEDLQKSIENIQRTLSLSRGATDDTTLRKLQSVMNDNVNTNWGARAKLVDELERHGAPGLKAALAGQQLQSVMPRGLARNITDPTLMAAAVAHGLTTLNPLTLGYGALLPLMSPRVAGAAAYRTGRAAGYLGLPEMLQRSQSMDELKALLAKRAQPLMSQMLMRQQ